MNHTHGAPVDREKVPTGISWLGMIPSGWRILRNRYLFREVDERSVTGLEPHLSMSQQYGLVPTREIEDWRRQSDSHVGDKLCRVDDLILNRLKAHLGVFARASQDGVVSPDYTVFRPCADISVRYFQHLFKTPLYIRQFTQRARGIVEGFWRLYTDDFNDIPTLVPPRSEQDAIVAFLDRKLEKINRYLSIKRRQIELCSEARVSLLATLLPSAVERASTKLKYLVDLLPGFVFPSRQFSADENDIRLLRGINISPGAVRWNEAVRWQRHDAMRFKDYELQVGDLVIGMDRPWISTGIRVAPITDSDVPSLLLQRVGRLRAKPGLEQQYLCLLLLSQDFKAYFEPILTGISVPHISPEQILDYRITLPPIHKQQQIVRRYAELSFSLDAATKNVEDEIALMTEYRTALISEAVTGRLDVRQAD